MNSQVKIGIVVVLLVLAGFLFWRQIRGPQLERGDTYWYDVSAEELFTASGEQIPPIRDGKGVRAHVYACGDESQESFIGYVEKYSDEGKAYFEENEGARGVPLPTLIQQGAISREDHLVARPDEMEWHPSESREGQRIKAYPDERCSSEKAVKVQP